MHFSSLHKKNIELDSPSQIPNSDSTPNISKLGSSSEVSNVIKVTQLGQEAIANKQYFGNWSQLRNNSVYTKKRSQKSRDKNQSKTQQNFWKQKQHQQGQSSQYFSKKTLRAYQNWQRNHSQINSRILKQIENRKIEKSDDYGWNNRVAFYRDGIHQIIGKWDSSHQEQQKRIKTRLKNIYEQKYSKPSQNGDKKKKRLETSATGAMI